MLKEIQKTGEGAVTVGLSDSDRSAGLMFVDDLHLMAQSIEGLKKNHNHCHHKMQKRRSNHKPKKVNVTSNQETTN